ncbi:MAG TPA: hypothetical protein EYP33_06305, partial [Pyrodictium sp.]|nr:hypothetical protein [Pyrodictium sp.]
MEVHTLLEPYGLADTTYPYTPFNISIKVFVQRPLYNVTLAAHEPFTLLHYPLLGKLGPGWAWINATVSYNETLRAEDTIMLNISIGYSFYPDPTWNCTRLVEPQRVYMLCLYTNVTPGSGNRVYVYTWPYMVRRLELWWHELIYNGSMYDLVYIDTNYTNGVFRAVIIEPGGDNATLALEAREAEPIRGGLEASIPVHIIPRNVTELEVLIDPENASICVYNP